MNKPYQKDKQQAFQAAQQAFVRAQESTNTIEEYSSEFGHQLKDAEKSIDQAEQMILNALEVASEHQRHELKSFQNELFLLKDQLEQK
ncbi:hypothetical protein [Desertibacillus haloalkaliphilus]|uniref:hypothetical protein n=1 Tax=Desertibacillus haloalkaliphilus TaxID=1328930 RepID=UPI001C2624A2|nr:hypothetical protein [Desertibacillus haloalkaliphilus]MBU8907419.1 hypothetical protein [Desertibacillus haloalkaliphilus]